MNDEKQNLPDDTPRLNFLGIRTPPNSKGNYAVTIYPIPFEKTTSYVKGTVNAPTEILKASLQIELYDEETDKDLSDLALKTEPPVIADSLDPLEESLDRLLSRETFPVLIGGEHTITLPAIKALSGRLPFSVLSLDAHADLRDHFDGTTRNHATVMRRVSEICPVVVTGVRSISREEKVSLNLLPVKVFYAGDIHRGIWRTKDIIDALDSRVYLSIDMDVFDPGLVPAVGTPEPGGFDWFRICEMIKEVTMARNLIGMDLVELCPLPHQHASTVTAARLISKILCYLFPPTSDDHTAPKD